MVVLPDVPNVPCRNEEVKQLVSLLGHPDECVPQCVFLSGHKSSGKSHTLTRVLESLNIKYAVVNCVEGYMPRLIYESILSQLLGKPFEHRCDDIMDFLSHLRNLALEGNLLTRLVVLVFEGCERLRDMSPNVLPALTRLQELSCLKNISVALLSDVLWDKFTPQGGLPPPIIVYFHQYSKNDILKILSEERPKDYPLDFYQNYLHLFVAVFFQSCRDLTELRYKAAENFIKYCEPIKKGEIDLNDSGKLWKHISPYLKASLQTIYMRHETGKKLDSEVVDTMKSTEKHNSLSYAAKYALSFELPYYAKYLIVAAFLASFNSPKEDKRLFVKLSGRIKKRMQRKSKTSQSKISSLVMGPRLFDLERLLAIFYSIIDEKPHISANLLTQISSLVELQLLLKIGSDPLELPKYKCAVGLDFIVIISKTLSFNVTKYLVDYK